MIVRKVACPLSHVATQAIRLRRSGTSLNTLRVTLWIATAIHLDTLNKRFDQSLLMGDPFI